MNRILIATLSLSFATLAFAQSIDVAALNAIDGIAAEQIRNGNVPGCVVLVQQHGKTVFRKAYGLRAKVPAEEPMTVDTIFDLASITKPVATASCIHQLIQSGKLSLNDRVAEHWSAFGQNGKRDVTIAHCLLHTTGLTADNSINDYKEGRDKAIENIAKLPLEAPPGTRFRYSDVGFIVLGELVHRISGKHVDQYAAEHFFKPLGMTDTGFNPKPSDRIAPTGLRDKKSIRGVVHDPRAFAMGGVAGHAGLFGTADDLGKYAAMLLDERNAIRESMLHWKRAALWNTSMEIPGGGLRSFGWDVDTSFSGQRGDLFPPGDGFGHTGFTGTSIWIDPPSKTTMIILSNRVHPDDKGNAAELRRKIGTIVALAVRDRQFSSGGIDRPTQVLCGIDTLKAEKFETLRGKTIGLVTNHTGKDRDGTSTIDLLAKAEGVTLKVLFSPEHGIRGEKDEKVGDGKDEKTGLPVYSLYGERRKPTVEQLHGLDAIVYDIQDIGCRFYTYISTLKGVMEIAAQAKVPVIVLDRPNPLGGKIAGPVLDAGRESFVGCHPIPIQHGLTVGELAKLFQKESFPDVKLTVMHCRGWHRSLTWDLTGLPWRNPSPNMRHLTAARLYPGVGLLETTNISVGRGTERPFEWIGAPWMKANVMAAELNRLDLKGVRFVPVERTPSASVHKDKLCPGVDIILNDPEKVDNAQLWMGIVMALRNHHKEWETKRLDTLLIHKATFDRVVARDFPGIVDSSLTDGHDTYRQRIQSIRIYFE